MSKISGITIVSATFRMYCACGATMSVTGTMDGIQTAVKLWSQDHRGKDCAPMTAKEHRAKKNQTARARRAEKRQRMNIATKAVRIQREQKALTRLFD